VISQPGRSPKFLPPICASNLPLSSLDYWVCLLGAARSFFFFPCGLCGKSTDLDQLGYTTTWNLFQNYWQALIHEIPEKPATSSSIFTRLHHLLCTWRLPTAGSTQRALAGNVHVSTCSSRIASLNVLSFSCSRLDLMDAFIFSMPRSMCSHLFWSVFFKACKNRGCGLTSLGMWELEPGGCGLAKQKTECDTDQKNNWVFCLHLRLDRFPWNTSTPSSDNWQNFSVSPFCSCI
jgi:hypothetical protein